MTSWGYSKVDGPETWKKNFKLATGKNQSPIDIQTEQVKKDTELSGKALRIQYLPENVKDLENVGHGLKVNINGNDSELSGGPLKNKYQLEQFHWHWGSQDCQGSEHTVDGQQFPAEMHFVHWNKDLYKSFGEAASKEGGLAVLGVFLKIGSEHKSLRDVINAMKKCQYKGQKCTLQGFDPATLLPGNTKEYWTYKGSLTTPPCYESVNWIVFRQPVEVSKEQMEAFRKLKCIECRKTESGVIASEEPIAMVDNFRPPQPLWERQVVASFH